MMVITLLTIVLELSLVRAFPVTPTEIYPYSETLVNGLYILLWKHNDTHITFETHVKTLGWVGFGISDNGNMYPGDVVVGWIRDGAAFLEDRQTIQYGVPIKDKTNDWKLLFGTETGDTTVLKIERAVDTCDTDHDKPITKDLMHVIFAWNDNDPEPNLSKHTTKGARQIYLLDPITPDVTLPTDAKSFMFSSNQATVPPQQTYYLCTAFIFPALESKHHAIAFEPVIEPGNEDIVHHAVVMACVTPFPDSDNGTTYECTGNTPPSRFLSCYNTYAAWATGGKTFYLPDDVGMTIGDASGPRYYVFQVHYNNDKRQSGRRDSSGIRAVYTSTLRQFDAGLLELGVQINNLQVIPPRDNAFVSRGYCTDDCLRQGMADGNPIYVYAVFLHSHLLGRKLRLKHIRNGVELKPISEDNSYDFDFQQTRVLRTPVIVQPTDTLIMECVYDSSDRVNVTMGGFGTEQEMCIAFVYYYPEMSRVRLCLSAPSYNSGQDFALMYREAAKWAAQKWNSVWDIQQFQCLVDRSEHHLMCLGSASMVQWFKPVPKIRIPYVAESTCPASSIGSANVDTDWCDDSSSSTTAKRAAGLLIVASFLSAHL